MDKELIRDTKSFTDDKFIVVESSKIRTAGINKLPPEGLPRDLSELGASVAVSRVEGRFLPAELVPHQGCTR